MNRYNSNCVSPTVQLALLLSFSGCGGGSGSASPATPDVPSVPTALAATLGDQALSLAWSDVIDDGGAPILGYEIVLEPLAPTAVISISGQRAVLHGLDNGIAYTVNVRARNSVGLGAAAQTGPLTPVANDTNSYSDLVINGDTSTSGIFDPSLLRAGPNELWMSYSGVDYYRNLSDDLVRDVGVHIAHSTDNNVSYAKSITIANPEPATVTDTDPLLSACGVATCIGRWNYETSFLIDDVSDPNPADRYKVFANKYFLNPAASPDTLYHLGAVTMWTAPDPTGPWSTEISLLGWNLTPPEATASIGVNQLASDLADCLMVVEGSAMVQGSSIHLAFACPYIDSAGSIVQKIVLLRTDDHFQTLNYTGTLLDAADAVPLGGTHYSAPALFANDTGAPQLIATPVLAAVGYAGCIVLPIADENSATLFRDNGIAQAIQGITVRNGRFGGACTAARDATGGVLLSEAIRGATLEESQFRIVRTDTSL